MPIASSLLNKPRLVEKLRKFYDYVQKNDGKVGTKTRGIDLNFNNACNLRCKYCFTNSPKGDHVKEYLDLGAIRKLADEADELGYKVVSDTTYYCDCNGNEIDVCGCGGTNECLVGGTWNYLEHSAGLKDCPLDEFLDFQIPFKF